MNNYIFGVPNNLCVQLSPSSFKQVDPVGFTDWNNSRILNMPGPWPFLPFVVRPQCRLFTSFYFGVNFLRVGIWLLENLGLKPKSLVRGWNCLGHDPAWLPRQRWDWPSLPFLRQSRAHTQSHSYVSTIYLIRKHPDDQFTMLQQMPGKDKHLGLTMGMELWGTSCPKDLYPKWAVLALNYHRH